MGVCGCGCAGCAEGAAPKAPRRRRVFRFFALQHHTRMHTALTAGSLRSHIHSELASLACLPRARFARFHHRARFARFHCSIASLISSFLE